MIGSYYYSFSLGKRKKNKSINVLFIFPWLAVGGTLTLFRPVIETLTEDGFRFTVVTTREKLPNMGDTTRDFEQAGSAVHHLVELGTTDEERETIFWEILRRGDFDTIVLVGSTFAYNNLSEIKRRFPRAKTVDQLFADSKHLVSNQQLNQYIDATVVPSELLANRVNSGLAKLHIIPHGIHVPLAEEQAKVRAQGAVQMPPGARNKFVVSFFGRLSPEKDPALFVDMVARLCSLPDIFFVMIGDGPERQNVLSRISEKGLTDKIFFQGFVESIDPFASISDLVVVPSKSDGQPLVVLHAMSYACPVVASSTGSIPIMVKHGETGYLCQPGNLEELVIQVRALYEDRQLARSFGLAGYKHLQDNFDKKRMIDHYKKVFSPIPRSIFGSAH